MSQQSHDAQGTSEAVQPIALQQVRAYHDESGSEQYTGHGVLLVSDADREFVLSQMAEARTGYTGEIHYTGLSIFDYPTKWSDGSMERAACNWLQLFFQRLHGLCHFTYLVVDKQAEQIINIALLEPTHLFSFGYAEAIKRGLRQFFPDSSVELSLYSDPPAKPKDIENVVPHLQQAGGISPYRYTIPHTTLISLIMAAMPPEGGIVNPPIPSLKKMAPEIVLIDSNPKKYKDNVEMQAHSELIQLTDLVGGLVMAFVRWIVDEPEQASNKMKVTLRDITGTWMGDVNFRIRFQLSFLPDPPSNGDLAAFDFGRMLDRMFPTFPLGDSNRSRRRG